MDSSNPNEHQSKKRRYFAYELYSNDNVSSPPSSVTAPTTPPAPASPTTITTTAAAAAASTFDRETFEAFVGENVDPNAIAIIQDYCGSDLDRAINMYLDGTWKKLKKKATSTGRIARANDGKHTSRQPVPVLQAMPEFRYIGAFGAEAWATTSSLNILKYGDKVKIERQRFQVQRTHLSSRQSAAAARKTDVVVRFTTLDGKEIGRLSKDSSDWVSALMDQQICRFEGTCVFAPERIRINDTILLQIRCFMLRSCFFGRGFQLSDNRSTGLFEASETQEEKDLRLRQVALVKLFEQVGLVPSRGNAAAARNAHESRQGLLQQAEMAENKENISSSPNSSDDNEDGQELEQDQLDALYKKAQTFDFNTPEAEPAETFRLTLRPYQKQSLHWMMAKEKDERNKERERSMHPLWEEYLWPVRDCDDKDLPQIAGQPAFYVNPYSGDLSLEFPEQEQHCLGGILADEMGLGKTIQMLSLIHTHRPEGHDRKPDTSVNGLQRIPTVSRRNTSSTVDAPFTTLVVAPMSLLEQWRSEAAKASVEGTLNAMVYYGADKNLNLPNLCCEANGADAPNVIITSYGVVLSEFSQITSKNGDRASHRGLFSLNFFRVILDEAHSIKNRQSKTARACYEITAEHRWVLTGTPIVNRLEDLFSLVRFLRVEPWNNFSFWRTFITVPFESKNYLKALDVVQTVLEPLVMRRTKDMRTPQGEPLVPLPQKTIEIVDIELSEAERAVYDYVYSRAKRTFNENVEAGTVMKKYTSIFAQILRLRQTCCHPTLIRKREFVADEEEAAAAADAVAGFADDMDLQSLVERFTAELDEAAESNKFSANVLKQIQSETTDECPICYEEPMIDQTVTGCWHSACKKCWLDYIKHESDKHQVPRCPQCREHINLHDLFEVVRHDDDPEAKKSGTGPRISLQRVGVNHSSAKIVALIKHLRELRRENPTMKTVVFSQFTAFLSLIEPHLARANMRFVRLDGTMSQKARAAVLNEFSESNKFTILLISLKAGGVGLNLTSAKRVFMMDPWWSYAVESQAIDRVHRMGQEDEVKVYRFIAKDSVEERMLKIQLRKQFIAKSLGMTSNEEEKRMQRIEDIRELLS
ncbi:DNA repair protein rad5 [Podospora fimiseda]|uniref:DNA repair protein rad5 n=1 Tax=Podospora fimiseda TaxID=252190 RepID=A0AAN7BYX9_9PEZI|nr:DNA repair protein rad5 [Podospora fimiseda]